VLYGSSESTKTEVNVAILTPGWCVCILS